MCRQKNGHPNGRCPSALSGEKQETPATAPELGGILRRNLKQALIKRTDVDETVLEDLVQ